MKLTPEQKKIQRVVCAAIMCDGFIICGARHFDKVMCAALDRLKLPDESTVMYAKNQGFIDQFGNFLTREEAWEIAERQGQFHRRCGGDDHHLFSENLY